MKTTEFTLETTSKLLIRCFWIGFAALTLWGLMYLVSGDLKYGMLEDLFGVTPHEFDVINYSAIIITKAFVFFGFLFPYIAIRMVLAQNTRGLADGESE